MKGKCHCGSIKYELKTNLDEVYYCNCRDCQILSGSGYHILGIVDRGSITLMSGEPAYYKNPTQSGHEMTRYFCSTCATPLYIESTRFKDISMLLVSTLEDPKAIEPSFEIWTQSKHDWTDKQCHLKRYERGACD